MDRFLAATTHRSFDALKRELESYLGNSDDSAPVSFSDIAKQYPMVARGNDLAIRMADFAEIGYCLYKSWHHAVGTSSKRTSVVELALQRGTDYHGKREAADRARAQALPTATKKELRNASINIAEIPELPGRIRVGGMIYMSRIERAGRRRRNLTIREIKTGTYTGAADHLLQTWGYCVTAPGILSTKDFTADGIEWCVEYPRVRKTVGPYIFSQRALSLLLEAMKQFESIYTAGRTKGGMVERVRVIPAKCRPCAFIHDCRWAAQTRP
jgi:hypothetical protein